MTMTTIPLSALDEVAVADDGSPILVCNQSPDGSPLDGNAWGYWGTMKVKFDHTAGTVGFDLPLQDFVR